MDDMGMRIPVNVDRLILRDALVISLGVFVTFS